MSLSFRAEARNLVMMEMLRYAQHDMLSNTYLSETLP